MIEIAGPERQGMATLIQRFLSATGDPRKVVVDRHARYFGIDVDDRSLMPGDGARLGPTSLDDWLRHSAATTPSAPSRF
jgi:hypothetical protein